MSMICLDWPFRHVAAKAFLRHQLSGSNYRQTDRELLNRRCGE